MSHEGPPEDGENSQPASEHLQNSARSSENRSSDTDDFFNDYYELDILSEPDVTEDTVASSPSASLSNDEAPSDLSGAEDPSDYRIRHNEPCSWETFCTLEEPPEGLYEYVDGRVVYCPPEDDRHDKFAESYHAILTSYNPCLLASLRPILQICDEYDDDSQVTDNTDLEFTSNAKSLSTLTGSSASTVASKRRGLCRPDLVLRDNYDADGSPIEIKNPLSSEDTSTSDTDSSAPVYDTSSSDSHGSSFQNSVSSYDNSIASSNDSDSASDSDNPSPNDEGSADDGGRSEQDSDDSFLDCHKSLCITCSTCSTCSTCRASSSCGSESRVSEKVSSFLYPYDGMVSAVIEITSNSSREHDLYAKWTAYARSQIPVYIIIDHAMVSNGLSRVIVGSLEKFSNAEPSSNGDPSSQVVEKHAFIESCLDESTPSPSSLGPMYYRKVYEPNEIIDCKFLVNLNMTAKQLLEYKEIGALGEKMRMERFRVIERCWARRESLYFRSKEWRSLAHESRFRAVEYGTRFHEFDFRLGEYRSRELEDEVRLAELKSLEKETEALELEKKSRVDNMEAQGDRVEREHDAAERWKDSEEFLVETRDMEIDIAGLYSDKREASEDIAESRRYRKMKRRDAAERRRDRKEELQDYREQRQDERETGAERTQEMLERIMTRAERAKERCERTEVRTDRAWKRMKKTKALLKKAKRRLKRSRIRIKKTEARTNGAETRSVKAKERLRKSLRRRRKNDKTVEKGEKYALSRQSQGLKCGDSDTDTSSSSEGPLHKRKLPR